MKKIGSVLLSIMLCFSCMAGMNVQAQETEGIMTADVLTKEKGDMNGDGKLSAVDALMIVQSLSSPTIAQLDAGDVNGDDFLDETDARALLQAVTGEKALPEPETGSFKVVQNSYWGDNGDGTFTNPVLPMDYSDPDVIRIGNDYYMVSSTFMDYPGVTVLHSTDLVNWETISYAIDDLAGLSGTFAPDSMGGYGNGIYAPSIRYHDGIYYVYSPLYRGGGIYVSKATDPKGPWTTQQIVDKNDVKIGNGLALTDLCPFWDDDGTAYLVVSVLNSDSLIDWQSKGNANIGHAAMLYQMSEDGTKLLDADAGSLESFVHSGVVIRNIVGTEGNKIYKKDGYYYFFNVDFQHKSQNGGGPYVRRARHIYGDNADGTAFDYEAAQEAEGTAYCHAGQYEMKYLGSGLPQQGAFIDTPDGKWYFMGQKGDYRQGGRETHLAPAVWEEGEFPTMTWAEVVEKPRTSTNAYLPVGSDDFEEGLSINWNWNHQPDKNAYSVADGKLRMFAQTKASAGSFWAIKNIINQKYVDTDYVDVTVQMNLDGMVNGQEAGITHFNGGDTYLTLGVVMEEDEKRIRFDDNGNDLYGANPIGSDTIYFRTIVTADKTAHFYYSMDGTAYVKAGEAVLPTSASRYYKGDRIGIYTFHDTENNGYVDVEDFRYEFTGPTWSDPISELPQADEMEPETQYPFEQKLEFENYKKAWTLKDGDCRISDNSDASGGKMVDNTIHNEIVYLSDFEGSYLEQIILHAGTRRNDAKAAIYAVDLTGVDVDNLSYDEMNAMLTEERQIGMSGILKYSSDNWNAYKDNKVKVTAESGEKGLFVRFLSSGSNFVGNFDYEVLCYTDYPFALSTQRIEIEDYLNAAWTSNPATSGGGILGNSKSGDVFYLGDYDLSSLLQINVNASNAGHEAAIEFYAVDKEDFSALTRAEMQAKLTADNRIAAVTLTNTVTWDKYVVHKVSASAVEGTKSLIARIQSSTTWGGNYDYIELISVDK
ncbi:MAG: family 43 glycosylhydrolase [Lachnospiraceae bacterium]